LLPRERREGNGGSWKKRELTGGPGLSAVERERGKGEPTSWAWPKIKGERHGVTGPEGRKEERGGENSIFFKHIFQMHFFFCKYFLAHDIWFLKQSSPIKCISMHATKCYSNLYLILIPQIYLFSYIEMLTK